MLRRVIAIGFWLVLVGLVCAACQRPAPPPARTYTVLYNDKEVSPFREDWLILQEYQKRRHVTLDVRLGDDADYERALAQAFESGDVPDIVLKVFPGPIEPQASAGRLLAFSDYEALMPHFVAYIEAHGLQDEVDRLRLENGKYYLLPGYQRSIQVQQWIYRRDLFEKHGIATPDTYLDLRRGLAQLKRLYPDSTPLTASWGGAHLFAIMGAGYGIPAGWNGSRHYDREADRWRFAPATDNYRALLSYLAQSYAMGILDPEVYTQEHGAYIAKLVDGRALVTVTWISSGFDNWNAELRAHGVPDGEWAPLRVPESTSGIRALPAVNPFRVGLTMPSRVADEPYFEDLLAFVDWATYSEEGMTLTTWGLEGVTYEVTDGGKALRPEIQTPSNPDGTINLRRDLGLQQFFDMNENAEYEDHRRPPEIVAFLDASLAAHETLDLAPDLDLDAGDIESIRIMEETLVPISAQWSKAFVTGEKSLATEWDEYIAELEAHGIRTMEAIWNAAWQNRGK